MIYKIIIALAFILVALPAQAQQKKFIAVQDCGDVKQITQNTVVNWGETPLFSINGVQWGPEGTKYNSGMMYFVNQDTGTWSLIALYPESIACVIAAGTKFTPYSQK